MSVNTEKTAEDLVKIEIDGQEVAVPKGAMIIQAADKQGIHIPRFCYHRKLSVAANCRMCMVDVEKAPKPLPACATPVMDGMKVYTRSKRALQAQQNVMEFLLINHPLDCPICDQGGECELQDDSMGYGRDHSRYDFPKRVHKDEDIGPLVATEMTRCILCTRCVRFLHEIAGSDELGGLGRGDRTLIGTYVGNNLSSEMSGNIIDLCPVGALTNKPFMYKARAWEMMAHPGVSMHDAIGSNLFYHTRRGDLMRAVPRDNEALNETWLADRDRYSLHGVDAEDRVTQPMVKKNGQWHTVDWAEALQGVVQQWQKVIDAHGPEQVAVLAGNQSTSEEYYLLGRLFDALGVHKRDHRLAQTDFSDNNLRAPRVDVRLAEIPDYDRIVLVGSHVRHEQPILGHRVRQAWLNGAGIAAFNSRDYDFNFRLSHAVIDTPLNWVKGLASLAKSVSEQTGIVPTGDLGAWILQQDTDEDLNHLAKKLIADDKSLFIIGQVANRHPQANLIKNLVKWLSDITGAEVYEMADGANAWGAALAGMQSNATNSRQLVENPAKAYVLYQTEWLDHSAPEKFQQALAAAEFNVAMTAFADERMREVMDVILPIGLMCEVSGSTHNNWGDAQSFRAAGHLPGEAKPGWRVLRVLANLLELDGFEYQDIDEVSAAVSQLNPPLAVLPAKASLREPVVTHFCLDMQTGIYDVDMLTRRSTPLQQTVHASAPVAVLAPADAEKLGIQDGQSVVLAQGAVRTRLYALIDRWQKPGQVSVAAGLPETAALDAAILDVTLEKGEEA